MLCVPKGIHSDTNKSLHGLVVEVAHAVAGHFGPPENLRLHPLLVLVVVYLFGHTIILQIV